MIVGMGVPPFKRPPAVPDNFVLYGEFPEYKRGTGGWEPTGWMRAGWIDPEDAEFPTTGRVNITHLTRKLTDDEMAGLSRRASNGSVLR